MARESDQDALIVGGGVIGLATARELHRRGLKRITVLERGTVGREASFAAAGMLAVQAETDKPGHFFEFCRAARDIYPEFRDELLEETGIDIELDRSGTVYLAFTDTDVHEIAHRYDWQRLAGLNIERLTAAETRRLEPFVSPDVRESLLFPDDWQVENRKLLAALEEYAIRKGLTIRRNEACKRLILRDGSVIGAETASGRILASQTILAAGAWTSLIRAEGVEIPEVFPVRGQIFGFRNAKRLFSHVIYSPRGYLVPRADGRIVAGATVENAGYENEVTRAGIDFVSANAFEIAPALAGLAIAEKCSGLRPKAADGLPVIGVFPDMEKLFIATGHYRNGILLGPLTARLIAEMIVDKTTPAIIKGFGPNRF